MDVSFPVMSGKELLVVEDHPLLRIGVVQVLEQAGYSVWHASTCKAAWDAVQERAYSAILVDVFLPDGNGIVLTARMRDKGIDTPVCVLSAQCSEEMVAAAVDAGANGYLTKLVDAAGFVGMVERLVSGEDVYDSVSIRLVSRALKRRTTFGSLSDRDIQVLRLLSEGMGTKEVAADIGVSVNTAKDLLRSVYSKLGESNRTAAVSKALRLGLIP